MTRQPEDVPVRRMVLLGTVSRLARPPLHVLIIAACTAWLSACGSTAVTSTEPTVINKCGLTLAGPQSPISPSGGSQQVVLTTTPECAWTASAEATWVARIEPSSGQGSGTLQVDVAPNPTPIARQTAILVNGVRAQIQQLPAPCEYVVSGSGAQSVAGGGGSFQLTVSTTAGCTWTASSPVSWIRVVSGSPGNGTGVVAFTVEPNDESGRVAAITIAGHSLTVVQAASGSPQPVGPAECTYILNPVSLGMPATGGDGSVGLTTACAWTATANVPWITVSSPSGTGSATVSFAVAANTGTARSGTISIGTATATISQAAAAPCSFGVSATTVDFEAAVSTGSVNVSGIPSCSWTATSGASWITITSGSAGSGNGTVAFRVTANPGAPRSGTLTVAGHVVTVNQAAECTVTLNPTLVSPIPATGATGQVITVTTGTTCAWTAASNASWININSGDSGTGAGFVIFTVAANNGGVRNGTLTVSGQVVTVTQSANCTVTPSPLSFSIPAAGATGRVVTVSAQSGCGWTAASNASWINITAGASGSGGGSVTFSVAANTGASREGTLTVAGQAVTVTQPGNCTVTSSPLDFSIPAAGATGRVVTVSAGSGCGWTATSNASWINITAGASGSGGGSVTFNVAANTGGSRSGTFTVGGQAVTVTQAGNCTLTATPLAFSSIPATGATGQAVSVTGGSGCGWTATSNASWLNITSGASGSGAGSVVFSVAANTGGARNGTLSIAGHTVTVSQSAPCSYNVSPPRISVPGAGGSGNFAVAAAAGCAWTAATPTPWLMITAGVSGSGNGAVTFSAMQNPGGARTGSLSIAGQTVFVDQEARCTYTANVAPRSFSDDGGTAVATVGTAAGCSWTVSSGAPWIVVPPPATRSGPGTVSITIQPNPGNKRDGVVTVAGQTFTIEQEKK